jgi:hypothetical protein
MNSSVSEHHIPLIRRHVTTPPDVDEAPHYDKDSQWVVIPYRRIGYIVLAVVLLISLILSGIESLSGLRAYQRLFFPHRAIHASTSNSKDTSRIVRPYFGPAKNNGVDNAKLLITVWFREGKVVELDPSHAQNWRMQYEDSSVAWGEQGFILAEDGDQNPWEDIWTWEMEGRSIEDSRQQIATVRLPTRVV